MTNDDIKNWGNIELSKAVKEVLFNKSNKGALYKSFASNMGNDFIPFVEQCNKQLKYAKEKRRDELKKELEQIESELKEEPTKTKKDIDIIT